MKKRGGWPGPAIAGSKSFTLWVPNEHHEKLTQLAEKNHQSVGAVVRRAISEMLNDRQDGPRRSGRVGGNKIVRAKAHG